MLLALITLENRGEILTGKVTKNFAIDFSDARIPPQQPGDHNILQHFYYLTEKL